MNDKSKSNIGSKNETSENSEEQLLRAYEAINELKKQIESTQKNSEYLGQENRDLRVGQTVKNERTSNMIGILSLFAVLFVGSSAINGFLSLQIANFQTDSINRIMESKTETIRSSVETANSIVPALTSIVGNAINSIDQRISESKNDMDFKIQEIRANLIEMEKSQRDFILESKILQNEIVIKAVEAQNVSKQIPRVSIVSVSEKLMLQRLGVTEYGNSFCNIYTDVEVDNDGDFSVYGDNIVIYANDHFGWTYQAKSVINDLSRNYTKFELRESVELNALPNRNTTWRLYKSIGVESAKKWVSDGEPTEPTNMLFQLLVLSRSGGELVLDIERVFDLDDALLDCMRQLATEER
jgi:hypothetical protein